jgi:hypothetical protein
MRIDLTVARAGDDVQGVPSTLRILATNRSGDTICLWSRDELEIGPPMEKPTVRRFGGLIGS